MPFDFMSLFILFLASIITQNMVLANFLGLCPFVAVSTEIPTALGMGAAVIFVMVMTMALNWPINALILVPFHVDFLQFLVYIMVIAAFVQIVELFIDRYSPVLYVSLGVFLPLITVNCAILGVLLISTLRELHLCAGTGVRSGERHRLDSRHRRHGRHPSETAVLLHPGRTPGAGNHHDHRGHHGHGVHGLLGNDKYLKRRESGAWSHEARIKKETKKQSFRAKFAKFAKGRGKEIKDESQCLFVPASPKYFQQVIIFILRIIRFRHEE